MFKQFLPILTFVSIGSFLLAQKPEPLMGISTNSTLETRSAPCTGQANAGVTSRNIMAGSKSTNIQFLCFGDSMLVTNTGSILTEDPNTATQAGIGYIFYDCKPTVKGPRWSNISADACLKKTRFGNTLPSPVWISRGNSAGRATFKNDGNLQNGFNNGNPLQIFFGAATIYGFSLTPPDIEGDTACMDIDIANSFPVVYLNPVRISNITYGANRSGSFRVSGGRPEYDGTNYTNFIIRKRSNPAITGTVVGTVTHNGIVSFTVPEDGEYDIIATDGVGCDATARIQFPIVSLFASNEQVNTGDNVCVKIKANGFRNVSSAQFWLTYNSSLLRLTSISNPNPVFGNNFMQYISASPPLGNVYVKDTIGFGGWFSNTAVNLADSTTLFEVCFQAIGPNGTISPIRFVNTDFPIEITDFPDGKPLGIDTTAGSVKIGSLPVAVTLRGDSATCNGTATGRINIIPSGAGAPFGYVWRNKANPLLTGFGTIATANDTGKINNLIAGRYYVTVTSSTNDTKIDSVDIFEPDALILNPLRAINPCQGQSNGSLKLGVFGGGTFPYTFRWSTGTTGDSITNLAGGNYTVTMTDAKGCTATTSALIGTVPIRITGRDITPALCKEVKTGGITITSVTGGTPTAGSYTFKWSNGLNQSGSTVANGNLGSGKYFVTISDNICEAVDSFTIPAQRNIVLNATATNIACNGQATGSVLVTTTATGSSNPPYRYIWTGIPAANINTTQPATSLAFNLVAGTYPLKVIDQDGCEAPDTTFTLTQAPAIKIDSILQKNESCLVGNDGSIQVAVSGGTPGYTYRWNTSAADNQLTLNNLKAGIYTFSVTDNANCVLSRAFNLTVPQKPILEVVTTDTKCANELQGQGTGSAEIKVTALGGAVVTGFTWDNGGVIEKISNVAAGTYRVTVSMSNGCQKDTFAVVNSPAPITIDTANSSTRNPTCPGFNDGQIILVMKGGTAPYIYSWSGGLPTGNSVFASLEANTYQFTITDFNNCPALQTTIPLIAPPEILVAFSEVTGVTCYGKCVQNKSDGRATANASGGSSNTGIFTYEWSSGETTARAVQLCGSWQSVTVSDGTCFKVDSVNIPQPQPFLFQTPVIEEPSCYGLSDGKIEVQIEGGTQPYAYTWSTGAVTKDIVNIPTGTYSVVVTDSRNCASTPLSIEVNQPLPMVIDTIAEETRNVTCYNFSDGQIAIRRVGGNGGRTTYAWTGTTSDSSIATNLKAGIYYVTATDRKGCKDTLRVDLQQPDKIYYLLEPPRPPRCFGELTYIKLDTAFGSTFLHPFTISVDNGPQYPIGFQVPVFADDHLVTITEQITGCSDTFSVTISQPPPITIRFDNILDSIPTPRILVGLGTEVRLNPVINSALPIDSVLWTPKDYLTVTSEPLRPTVRPLDDRLYKLRVTDVNGCIGEAELLVELERNRNIFIPNVFSPNGDDKNDYFGVFSGAGVKAVNYLRIFDRWGELIYQVENLAPSNDPSSGWDGTFRGKPVIAGVYVFLAEVEFDDGAKLLYRGDVTVAR